MHYAVLALAAAASQHDTNTGGCGGACSGEDYDLVTVLIFLPEILLLIATGALTLRRSPLPAIGTALLTVLALGVSAIKTPGLINHAPPDIIFGIWK